MSKKGYDGFLGFSCFLKYNLPSVYLASLVQRQNVASQV